jgi:hypothetical protein
MSGGIVQDPEVNSGRSSSDSRQTSDDNPPCVRHWLVVDGKAGCGRKGCSRKHDSTWSQLVTFCGGADLAVFPEGGYDVIAWYRRHASQELESPGNVGLVCIRLDGYDEVEGRMGMAKRHRTRRRKPPTRLESPPAEGPVVQPGGIAEADGGHPSTHIAPADQQRYDYLQAHDQFRFPRPAISEMTTAVYPAAFSSDGTGEPSFPVIDLQRDEVHEGVQVRLGNCDPRWPSGTRYHRSLVDDAIPPPPPSDSSPSTEDWQIVTPAPHPNANALVFDNQFPDSRAGQAPPLNQFSDSRAGQAPPLNLGVPDVSFGGGASDILVPVTILIPLSELRGQPISNSPGLTRISPPTWGSNPTTASYVGHVAGAAFEQIDPSSLN